MKLSNSALLIAVVLVFSAAAHAQSHEAKTPAPAVSSSPSSSSVRLGEKLVVVPSPAGFEEASLQFPKVKEVFVATEDPGNDMLLAHLSVQDCNLLRKGTQPTMNLYTKVSVLRQARDQAITNTDISSIASEFRKNGAALLDPEGSTMKGVMENAERGLNALDPKSIELGLSQSQILGEFNVKPESYSVMLLLTYKADAQGTSTTFPVLASLTMLKVKDRLLYVNVFRRISSTAALKAELKPGVEEVKQFTTKWVKEILSANPDDK